MKTITLLLAVALTCLATSADNPEKPNLDLAEYKAGVDAAIEDLSNSIIKYGIVGQPRLSDVKLKAEAKEKLGVEVILHGCIRDPRIDYDEGYKNTVVAFLKKKHGYDPIIALEKKLTEQILAKRRQEK